MRSLAVISRRGNSGESMCDCFRFQSQAGNCSLLTTGGAVFMVGGHALLYTDDDDDEEEDNDDHPFAVPRKTPFLHSMFVAPNDVPKSSWPNLLTELSVYTMRSCAVCCFFVVVVFLQELGFYVLLVCWPFLTVSFQVVRRRCLTHSHKRCVQQDCLTLTHALCQTGLSHTFKNELCFSTARLHVLERQITNNNFAGMLPFIVDDYHSIPCCPPPPP